MNEPNYAEAIPGAAMGLLIGNHFPQNGGRLLGALNSGTMYPHYEFPPVAYRMIEEMSRNIQTPLEINISIVLASMSAASQSWIRVQLPNEDKPQIASLMIFTGADSGAGKTKAADQAFRSFRIFSLNRLHQHVENERPRLIQSTLHRAKYNALRSRLTKLYDPAKHAPAKEVADAENALSRHIEGQVHESKPRLYVKGDISIAKLLNDLHGTNVPALWTTDEGQTFFGKMTKESMEAINQIWDGQTVTYDRMNQSAIVEEPLVTVYASTPLHEFDRFIKNKGRFALPGGLLPRALMVKAPTGALMPSIMSPTWSFSDAFNARTMALLEEHERLVANGTFKPITLEFDDEAKRHFMGLLDQNRHRMSDRDQWAQIQRSARKHPSNVARIAAIFHFFGEQPGIRISKDTLCKAIKVADWYTEQAKQILVVEPTRKRLNKLITFLNNNCLMTAKHRSCVQPWETHFIPIRWIQQFHNISQDDLVPLLQALFDGGMAMRATSWSGAQCITLNPTRFRQFEYISFSAL